MPNYKTAAERKAAYQSTDFEVSAEATPTVAEMDAVGAKDPAEFFKILMAKEKKSSSESETDNKAKGGMADKSKKKKNYAMGGAVATKKPAMMKGGMANGKTHMYAAGGMCKDNRK